MILFRRIGTVTVLKTFDLDDDGKIDLSAIYDQPDPRSYYQTLIRLDYRIPEAARSIFSRLIQSMRGTRERQIMTVLDVGSSYGVNAAILKHGYGLSELFNLYSLAATAGLTREQLIERDRSLFQGDGDANLETIGLDTAEAAIDYACATNILDSGIVADLELRPPSDREASRLGGPDLVISTGAIGYVGAPTFQRILDSVERLPWMALFALRMFPIAEIAGALKARGYQLFHLRGQTFRQRRFAGANERTEVLTRLASLGIDPTGRELEGWYHAEFFLALPEDEAAEPPLANLFRV
jgi:hypothetical protein